MVISNAENFDQIAKRIEILMTFIKLQNNGNFYFPILMIKNIMMIIL